MRIVIFEAECWERESFPAPGGGHELTFVESPLSTENAGQFADAEGISTFIYSDLDVSVLEKLSALRFIATRSTGYDHIALEHCRARDIMVSNVPTYGSHTVAEHIFALLLAISHRLVEAVDRTRRADFSLQGLRGFDLRGIEALDLIEDSGPEFSLGSMLRKAISGASLGMVPLPRGMSSFLRHFAESVSPRSSCNS